MTALLLSIALMTSAAALPPAIPTLRDQARVHDTWTRERLDTLAPALMREHGVDMWVLVAREYLEDPVLATMLDAESMRARRRTILVLFDPGGGKPVERLTVSRYGVGELFAPSWSPEAQPDQWKALAELIAARDPKRIAVNVSDASAFADGLTQSQHQALTAVLPPRLRERVVPAGDLAIDWLQVRTPAEAAAYPGIVAIAHAILAEGLSSKAVKPGRTTAADLEWWFRERIAERKLTTWFHPSVAIFRQGVARELSGNEVIRPGDMIWTDFGIMHMGLATDTQQLAYVLRPGERDAPAGLKAGLAAANRVQDALTGSFQAGLTGNDLLLRAREKALAQGLQPSIYSHPIGFHGHGAGPAIGFWDDQRPSDRGAGKVRANTAWSIELNNMFAVPEWGGQRVPFRLEEDAYFDGRQVRYLNGRQTRFHLVR
jgi:Xaa-Pro aminopeptidase